MSSCPMSTPASRVPTTVPRLNVPNRSWPRKQQSARARKIGLSCCSRKAVTRYSSVGSTADDEDQRGCPQQEEEEEAEGRGHPPLLRAGVGAEHEQRRAEPRPGHRPRGAST